MKWVVDRIEETYAVCYAGETDNLQMVVPVAILPEGLREGDHLIVTFEIDRASTQQEQQKAEELINQLTKKEDRGRKKFKL